MKRMILLAVALSVGCAVAGWRGRFDEQFAASVAEAEWTPAALNPVAWYKAENNATDSAGAFSGTWSGTAAYTDGKVGRAFRIRSTEVTPNYISATPWTSAIDRESGFTTAAWILRRGIFADYGELSFTTAGQQQKFTLACVGPSTTIMGRFEDAANTRKDTAAYDMPINEWTHVALVLDATRGRLYINGVQHSQTAEHTSAYTLDGTVFYVGGYRNAAHAGNPVDADDVLVFDRALSADEVKKLYDESVKRNGRAWK